MVRFFQLSFQAIETRAGSVDDQYLDLENATLRYCFATVFHAYFTVIMTLTCARCRKDVCLLRDCTKRLTAEKRKTKKLVLWKKNLPRLRSYNETKPSAKETLHGNDFGKCSTQVMSVVVFVNLACRLGKLWKISYYYFQNRKNTIK